MSRLEQYLHSGEIGLEQFDPILGSDASLFYLDTGVEKIYRLFLEDFVPGEGGQIHRVFNELLNAAPDATLEIRMSSNGGSVDEGSRMLSVMANHFPERTVGVLETKGYSMGATLFSYCDKRIIYPLSRVMYHNYSSFLMGKGGELNDRLDHTEDIMETFFRPILEKGFLTDDEYERMKDGKDIWLNATEMCKRGIATHVMFGGQLITAEDFLKQG